MRVKRFFGVGLCLTMTCLLNSAAFAQNSKQSSSADSVVGTWILVSETAHKDGTSAYPLGDKPLGSIMLDSGGHFILLIARPDLPKFAAGTRDSGTPEENKAVLAGLLAFCGTFRVDESKKALVLLPWQAHFLIGWVRNRNGISLSEMVKWSGQTVLRQSALNSLKWSGAAPLDLEPS